MRALQALRFWIMFPRRSLRHKMPNKTLQATAAALHALAVAWSHNAVVAGASALPAAVPELGR